MPLFRPFSSRFYEIVCYEVVGPGGGNARAEENNGSQNRTSARFASDVQGLLPTVGQGTACNPCSSDEGKALERSRQNCIHLGTKMVFH